MTNLWKTQLKEEQEKIERIAQNLGVNRFFARLLLSRNITTQEEAKAFFNPSADQLHDPWLMADMRLAVDRIDRALNQDEKVWVYGDYDVDGTTSVAMFYGFLRQFIPNIDYYIPDRETEGYGVSEQAIDLAIESKVNLIVTLDCGIRSEALVKKAKQHGIDFIICDHHEVGEELPDAVAVLDPKRGDCDYPYKELSACGVGFKLIQALCQSWDLPEDMPFDFIDLVAVSIASDLVPITGENRVLAALGLKKLEAHPSKGLQTVLDRFMNAQHIDITNLVFMIGPRINAAGRMASGMVAVKLLLAENDFDADDLATRLNTFNTTRQQLDRSITEQALDMLAGDPTYPDRKTTVVYDKNWHKGVIGIVASRLLEQYYKPTIVLTQKGEKIVGSARSIEGFDIHHALEQCSAYLEQFGGHKFAAGMTLLPENLDDFKAAFEKTASHLTDDDLTPVLYYESEIQLSSVSYDLYDKLKRFAPFGPGNRRPVFLTRRVRDTGSLRTMGEGYKHLKLNIISGDQPIAIGATAFGLGHYYDQLKNGQSFDILYTIEENRFGGQAKLELMVKDIRLG